MARHEITVQPGDELIVHVDDLEFEEEEDDNEDDVLGEDDEDEDDDDEDDEDPEKVLESLPEDLLRKELERREKEKDKDAE